MSVMGVPHSAEGLTGQAMRAGVYICPMTQTYNTSLYCMLGKACPVVVQCQWYFILSKMVGWDLLDWFSYCFSFLSFFKFRL